MSYLCFCVYLCSCFDHHFLSESKENTKTQKTVPYEMPLNKLTDEGELQERLTL